MYVMDSPKKSRNYLHFVAFSYNNGNHTSTNMIPFKIMYGRKYHTRITWDNLMDRIMLGFDMLKYLEQIVNKVRKTMKMV